MKYSTLIFDLDGTLTDPVVGIVRCMNYALTSLDYQPRSQAEITPYIGPPLETALQELSGTDDEQRINQLVIAYRERYGEFGYAENTVYDGVIEMLDKLHATKTPMGVCTTKFEKYAIKILKEFNLFDYFQFVSGVNTPISKAAQLTHLLENSAIDTQALMIGDRATDITAARHNGLDGAAVLWGYGSAHELQQEQPRFTLNSPADLLEELL